MGISAAGLRKIEDGGVGVPRESTIFALAHHLRTTEDYLRRGVGESTARTVQPATAGPPAAMTEESLRTLVREELAAILLPMAERQREILARLVIISEAVQRATPPAKSK